MKKELEKILKKEQGLRSRIHSDFDVDLILGELHHLRLSLKWWHFVTDFRIWVAVGEIERHHQCHCICGYKSECEECYE